MNLRLILSALLVTGALTAAPLAEARRPYKNLKVLADNGRTLKRAMKYLSKGLGVKCTACHIKGKWAKDNVAEKDDARRFFRGTVGVADRPARSAALADLLKILDRSSARNEALVWKAVSMFEKSDDH